MTLSLGLPSALGPEVAAAVAPEVERLGYDTFWSNDGREAPGLQVLAAAQSVTSRMRLGVNVIPVDVRSPEEIVRTVRELGLDPSRVILGVGSGRSQHRLDAVRASVTALRAGLAPGTVIGVAALGPRMCRLGGELADVVLLNWMTPARIEWARRRVAEGERRGGRAAGSAKVAMYVRVAIGHDAETRLSDEARRYSRSPNYATHFETMGVAAKDVGVASLDGRDVPSRLDPYRRVLDETIVRVRPATSDAEGVLAIARAAM